MSHGTGVGVVVVGGGGGGGGGGAFVVSGGAFVLVVALFIFGMHATAVLLTLDHHEAKIHSWRHQFSSVQAQNVQTKQARGHAGIRRQKHQLDLRMPPQKFIVPHIETFV